MLVEKNREIPGKEVENMNLKALAYKLRKDTIDIICSGKAGHIGGDMSVMEILTELYFRQMKIDPANPKDILWRHTMRYYLKRDFWIKRM